MCQCTDTDLFRVDIRPELRRLHARVGVGLVRGGTSSTRSIRLARSFALTLGRLPPVSTVASATISAMTSRYSLGSTWLMKSAAPATSTGETDYHGGPHVSTTIAAGTVRATALASNPNGRLAYIFRGFSGGGRYRSVCRRAFARIHRPGVGAVLIITASPVELVHVPLRKA